MAQFARPDSDVSVSQFTGTPDNTNLYENLNESVASDSDYIYSDNNVDAIGNIGLSNVTDPQNTVDLWTFRFRHAKMNNGVLDTGGQTIQGEVILYSGLTTVLRINVTFSGWTQHNQVLSTAEKILVGDFTDLRVGIVIDGSTGGNPNNRRGGGISWIEFELPDASSPATKKDGLFFGA